MSTTPLRTFLPGRRLLKRSLVRLHLRSPEPQLACRAPFTSLHVDQFGDARPCCQSSRVLGNLAEQTLSEIWNGGSLSELREAIRNDDLSLGCEHCEWAGRGGREATYAARFDRARIAEGVTGPTWLELAPSNSCNLQCTMCNGDWSSSIRLHREGRPALPRRFGSPQLAEVEGMAAELDELHLFGGEPLLMPEALRLLEVAAVSGTRCVITTNGSVMTPRVVALLDRPGVDVVVSVDGASAEVYESIRRGASWPVLLEHLDRLRELAAEHRNKLDLAHCLMVQNWHEFPDLLTWAAGLGIEVYVNDVVFPVEASLHHLSPPELSTVVRRLHERAPEVEALGAPWRATWTSALARLEQSLADGAAGGRHIRLGQPPEHPGALAVPIDAPVEPVERPAVIGAEEASSGALARAARAPQVHVVVHLDDRLVVSGVDATGRAELVASIDTDGLVGRRSNEVISLLAASGRLEDHATRSRAPHEVVEERRYHLDVGPVTERRTIRSGPHSTELRFEYRFPPTAADDVDIIRSVLEDQRYVELEIDGRGQLTAIGPVELAAALGLRTELGITCASPTDLLVPERCDPAPVLWADEIEGGLVEIDLTWPDGHHLVALARSGIEGSVIRLGRAAAGLLAVGPPSGPETA